MGIAKSEEDILTYILYPAIVPLKFLKGEMGRRISSSSRPLPCSSAGVYSPNPFQGRGGMMRFTRLKESEPIGGGVSISEASKKKAECRVH